MRENEPLEGCGHELAGCHHGACLRAAGGAFLLGLLTEPGGGVSGRALPLFGKSCLHLAGTAACGLSKEQLSCHWAWPPQAECPLALEEAPGPTQERVWAGLAERRLAHPHTVTKGHPTGVWTWPVAMVSGRTVGNTIQCP